MGLWALLCVACFTRCGKKRECLGQMKALGLLWLWKCVEKWGRKSKLEMCNAEDPPLQKPNRQGWGTRHPRVKSLSPASRHLGAMVIAPIFA
jgi:hypothetical protein